jgi:hypothetical protein
MKFLPRDGFQVCVELGEFAHAEMFPLAPG